MGNIRVGIICLRIEFIENIIIREVVLVFELNKKEKVLVIWS